MHKYHRVLSVNNGATLLLINILRQTVEPDTHCYIWFTMEVSSYGGGYRDLLPLWSNDFECSIFRFHIRISP